MKLIKSIANFNNRYILKKSKLKVTVSIPGSFIFYFLEFEKDGHGSLRFRTSTTYMLWTIMDCLFDVNAKIESVPKFGAK